MTQHLTANYTRAQRVITARAHPDPDVAAREEAAIAGELLEPAVTNLDNHVRSRCHPKHRHMTAFAATEAFATELNRAMTQLAMEVGAKAPTAGKYDPRFSKSGMFKDVWATRQVVDRLGIPYEFFVQQAIAYWVGELHPRAPRPTQLCSTDVVAHVLTRWAEVAAREARVSSATDSQVDASRRT